MSEVTDTDLAWSPPPFPAEGRLPSQPLLVGQHCHLQNSSERNYRQELCLAAGQRVEPPCCKSLHISLFFDGAGNNLNADTCRIKSSLNIPPEYSATLLFNRESKKMI